MAKVELLGSVEGDTPDLFLTCLDNHSKKRKLAELEEAVCELSRVQVDQIWSRLHSWVDHQLELLVAEDDSNTQRVQGEAQDKPEAPVIEGEEAQDIPEAPVVEGEEGQDIPEAPVVEREEGQASKSTQEASKNPEEKSPTTQSPENDKQPDLEGSGQGEQQEATDELRKNSEAYNQKLLEGVINFACIYINIFNNDDIYIPDTLLDSAVLLHGMVSVLEGGAQEGVVRLCEAWWTKRLDQHELLISNIIPILIQAATKNNAQKKDVMRVWSVFDEVKQMPLASREGEAFVVLLVSCAGATVFLSCDAGIKWLAGLFLLPTLLPRMHKEVKAALPTCTRLQSAKYAEVYFRAWKLSIGDIKKSIEEDCLQDLMFAGIHMDPAGRYSSNLHHFLHQIHRQKRHYAVSTMLCTLYQPILWRSLKVANGLVRMNATGLLCDAFPLSDANLTHEERGDLMEQQYQAIITLLTDVCHLVRITIIKGVFSILSNYWLMVPSHIIKTIFQKLLSELLYDASSSEVRTQVVRGLTSLLDSRDAAPFLTDILPRIGEVFDDPSVNVREAFVKLLLKVEASKIIKYWDIVKIEHLLHRLEEDKPVVCKQLTQLLIKTFHPSGSEDQDLIERCLALLDENRAAARRFYQYASRHLDLHSTVHFMLLLWHCLTSYVRMNLHTDTAQQEGEGSSSSSSSSSSGRHGSAQDRTKSGETSARRSVGVPTLPSDKENSDTENIGGATDQTDDEQEEDSPEDLDDTEEGTALDDPRVLSGLLDTVVILWSTNAPRLAQPNNFKFLHALRTRVSKKMPLFFKYFKDNEEVSQTLLYLSSFLPRRLVPTLVGHCLSRLRTSQAQQHNEKYGTYINALCNWNRADDVLELATEWLDEAFKLGTKEQRRKSQHKVRGVRFCEANTPQPQPMLALRLVRHILHHPSNKLNALQNYRHLLLDITTNMARVKDLIAERLNYGEELSDVCSDTFLRECWEQYLILVAVLHKPTIEATPEQDLRRRSKRAGERKTEEEERRDKEREEGERKEGEEEEEEESDGEHEEDLLFDSSACVCQCWEWASSVLIPRLSGDDDDGSDDSGSKRKDRAGDKGRALIVEVLSHLVTGSTHIIMTGAATTHAVHTICSSIETLVKRDSSGSFWCKSLSLAEEAHQYLQVYEDDGEQGEGGREEVTPTELVNSIISAIAEYAKHHNNMPQDMDEVSKSLVQALVVLGQKDKQIQAEITTHIASTVIDHLSAQIEKTKEVDLSVKKVCGAGECIELLVGGCQTRANLSTMFMQAFTEIISTAIVDSISLLASSYLLRLLVSDSGKISRYSLKQAVVALDTVISRYLLFSSDEEISGRESVRAYEEYANSSKKILQDLKTSLGVA